MVFIIVYMSPFVPTIVKSVMPVDGKPNINIDYNGSGIAFFNIDSDENGKPDFNLINQDTNKDGKISGIDLLNMQKHVLGKLIISQN